MPTPGLPLQTDRLVLRAYRPDDLDGILGMLGRADVARYLMWEPMDPDGARAFLDRRLGQTRIEQEGEGLALAVEERATGRYAGEVILRLISEQHGQGEVGWVLHPDAQGRGYATEAAREMLRSGFADVGLHRIVAECDPRNDASVRVMERLGMRREALHLESLFVKGEWVGSLVYAILASEWRALESPSAPLARG